MAELLGTALRREGERWLLEGMTVTSNPISEKGQGARS
jgi:hypothetical protein